MAQVTPAGIPVSTQHSSPHEAPGPWRLPALLLRVLHPFLLPAELACTVCF